jgi:hypothetical protein
MLTGLAVLALCGGVLGLWSPPSALASCVGPQLRVGSGSSEAGDPPSAAEVPKSRPLTVSGEWFHEGCNDTGTSAGCSGPSPAKAEPPMRDVILTLVQGSSSWALGTADAAGQNYTISWAVRLPVGVEPGPAVLSTPSTQVTIEITD